MFWNFLFQIWASLNMLTNANEVIISTEETSTYRCFSGSECHNLIFLSDLESQYFYCTFRSCQNLTIFLTSDVKFALMYFGNVIEPDNNMSEYISVSNINIYSSADYLQLGFLQNAFATDSNIYVGSIYSYLPSWFNETFNQYNNESYFEPLTFNTSSGLWFYSNQNGTKSNVNLYCNGSVDGCLARTTNAGEDGFNDVTMYCSITEVNSTSEAYPDNSLALTFSPNHPKCMFYCLDDGHCVVKLICF